jgi:predicted O-methyltransferase YrrM
LFHPVFKIGDQKLPVYQFTTPWFDNLAKPVWSQLIPQIKPKTILEVGSYEGASACFLIDTLCTHQEIEITCVDTWLGGVEHQADGISPANMSAVERNFDTNLKSACNAAKYPVHFTKIKGPSDLTLAHLLSTGKHGHYDLVYIDGSHLAADVLCDAVLGFRLLKTGGVMIFDDYNWHEGLPQGVDLTRCPKPAIDAFTSLYWNKIQIIPAPLYQIYIQKTAA